MCRLREMLVQSRGGSLVEPNLTYSPASTCNPQLTPLHKGGYLDPTKSVPLGGNNVSRKSHIYLFQIINKLRYKFKKHTVYKKSIHSFLSCQYLRHYPVGDSIFVTNLVSYKLNNTRGMKTKTIFLNLRGFSKLKYAVTNESASDNDEGRTGCRK